MSAQIIEGYRNVPGEHCGSTAMRNLIHHYCGLELSEPCVFGLGSGLDFLLLESDRYEPGVLMFGRSPTMEVDLADTLGLSYTEQIEPDDARAWEVVREEVLAGRPTMLSGDALYLDYRDFKVHFPAHRFVLLGFDDVERKAFVADRLDPAPQPCAYEALAASRNPKDFLSTYNLWGKFHDGHVRNSLIDAYGLAIERVSRRMLGDSDVTAEVSRVGRTGDSLSFLRGIDGLAAMAGRLPHYLALPAARTFARYAAGCIESFGTGGGNFRLMYASFLREAREAGRDTIESADVDGMRESARLWTDLAAQMRSFASGEAPQTSDVMVTTVLAIRDAEARVFERLVD